MAVDLQDLRRALAQDPTPLSVEDARSAAVAAVLTPSLELLFIRRSERPGDPWSGHVSFPGGHVEPSDNGPLDASIRETHEETGVDLSRSAVLGQLNPVSTTAPLPRKVIHAYVFLLHEPPSVRLNAEAASLHRMSLSRLLANEGRGQMTHPWRGRDVVMPRVDFDGVRLWGLTLMMVDDLLHRLDGRGRGLGRLGRARHD